MGIIILFAFLALVVICLAFAAVLNRGHTASTGEPIGLICGVIAGVVAFIAVIIFFGASFASVGVGDVGVPVTFGHAGGDLQPGIHLLAPWTDVVNMNVQTQNQATEATVRSADNISSNVDATVLFAVNKTDANSVYRTIGVNYLSTVIVPTVGSALQDQSVHFNAVDLNAADRSQYEHAVLGELNRDLNPRGITVQKVLVNAVDLPPQVASAAEQKVALQQQAESQQYALQSAQQQVAIAQQQANANNVLSQSLTPNIICNNWVNALAKGQITGPIYTSPCSAATSGVSVLVPGK